LRTGYGAVLEFEFPSRKISAKQAMNGPAGAPAGLCRAEFESRPGHAPGDLALAVLSAVQGGLPLSRSAKSDRPLALAFDMALAHVARRVRRPGATEARRAVESRRR
jgi:hypothetical protein